VRLRPRYVRDRLALWYVLVSVVMLAIYIWGAGFLQFWQLTSQVYHAEIQDVETAEGLLYFNADGSLSLHEDYHNHPQSRLLLDRLMEVLTPDGKILFRNEKLSGRELGGPPTAGEGQSGYDERSFRLQDGTRVLLISHVHSIGDKPLLIRLAYSTEPLTHRLIEFVGLLLLAVPFALVAAWFAGYRLAGKALSPLEEMVRQTEQISASSLHDRVPVENPDDELGRMASVLNDLLRRLQESFDQMRRFTSDVSHELRTPLASIRSVGEVGLQRTRNPEGYREVIGSMLEEVTRLTQTVDTLLTISRADAGQIVLHKTTFLLDGLLNETIGLVGVLAEEKGQTLSVSSDATISVLADRAVLRQALLNLLENAVKYSPVDSNISVVLQSIASPESEVQFVELTIEDSGHGIPAEARERVFDRFYRVDEARSREAGGAGLGLAIAKWAVEAQGGAIGLETGKRGGCAFYIRLPVANGDAFR
jgi:heavy metal sensor kinase